MPVWFRKTLVCLGLWLNSVLCQQCEPTGQWQPGWVATCSCPSLTFWCKKNVTIDWLLPYVMQNSSRAPANLELWREENSWTCSPGLAKIIRSKSTTSDPSHSRWNKWSRCSSCLQIVHGVVGESKIILICVKIELHCHFYKHEVRWIYTNKLQMCLSCNGFQSLILVFDTRLPLFLNVTTRK